MSETPTQCPRCSGKMLQGFVFESEGPKRIVSSWVEAAPEAIFARGAKTSGQKRLPIATFCCSECGFLESYARPEYARPEFEAK